MAHKKGGGSSTNGRDSNPQYLGVKKFGGEKVLGGQHPRAAKRDRRSSRVKCGERQGRHAFRVGRRRGQVQHFFEEQEKSQYSTGVKAVSTDSK